MQWGSRRRFAIIGSGCLIVGLLLMSMGVYIMSSTYSYYLFALIISVLSLVLLSLGTTVLVVGSLRAS